MSDMNRISFEDTKDDATTTRQGVKQTGESKTDRFLRSLCTVGTPLCGFVFGLLGAVIATLILTIGFWKTLFVFVCIAIGTFCGLIAHKVQWLRDTINRLFPSRDQD